MLVFVAGEAAAAALLAAVVPFAIFVVVCLSFVPAASKDCDSGSCQLRCCWKMIMGIHASIHYQAY